MKLFGALCALTAAVIWGGMYVVSKVVLDSIPPLTLVAIRFGLCSVVLFAALRLTKAKLVARQDLWKVALIGVIGFGISIVAQNVGTKLTNASMGALVTSASPAFMILFAALPMLGVNEPITRRKLLSLALATLGVGIVIAPTEFSSSLFGNVMLLMAALTWGLYSVLIRAAVRDYPTLTVSAYAGLSGALCTALLAPIELSFTPIGALTPTILLGVIYLALVSTALAMYLWNKALELLGAGITSIFFFAQPVAGAWLGWLFLSERLEANFFVGGAMILGAVGLATRFDK
jgi:drug/metabolite transporter (DMT)-like permease